MKTKYILSALALPALFAACTADDIEGVNNGLQQDERAKLSKDFVLKINSNGAESRYAVVSDGAGLNFVNEEGDKIGANLIDAYDPSEQNPAKWDITPYVAPSLPFKYMGNNEWKSDAELGVGNYLFTYPFNAKDNGRAAAQFELPRVQNYSSEDPNAIIEDNNKAVGAVVLLEGETEAEAKLKNLYTYPKVVINFDNGEEVKKVTKVILQKTSGSFIYKGGIHHEAVAAMFLGEADWVEDYMEDNNVTKEEATDAYWAQFETSDFIIDGVVAEGLKNGDDKTVTDDAAFDQNGNATGLAAYGKPEPSQYLIVEMNEAVKANATTNNKSVEVRLMMPSETSFASTNIVMHVVTDNGTYGFDLSSTGEDIIFKTDNQEKIEKALTRSSSNTLRTKNLKLSSDKSTGLGNIVTTAADWNALVESTKGNTQDVEVSILDSEFALTKDLKMPVNAQGFTINTPISVEGEVALANINATEVTVKKGATLTTSATFSAKKVCVEEGAELVFAAKLNADEEVEAYTGVTEVCNHGAVTVPADVIATFKLTNAKDATVTVAEDGILNLTGSNDGIINNNGVINASEFTNNTPNSETGYEYDKEEGWDGYPTINNKGSFKSAETTVTNKGLFVNEGTLTSNITANGEINNEGTIKVATGASTFIDTNKDGEIELAEVAPANFTIFDATAKYGDDKHGIITYIATGKSAEVELKNSPVTKLVAEGNIELKNTFTYTATGATTATVCALPELYVLNGGSVKVAATTKNAENKDVVVAKVSKLYVLADAAVGADMNSVAAISVADNATVTVPAGTTLTLADYTNVTAIGDAKNGVLQINGTLKLTSVQSGTDDGLIANPAVDNTPIVVGKLGKVYGVANVAPENKVENHNLTLSDGNLYSLTQTNEYKAVDNNDTYVLTISSNLNMDETVNTDKKNANYVSVLNNAKEIIIEGADIINLKESYGVSLAKLTVEGNVEISGSANMNIISVGELNVTEGAKLDIVGGNLKMTETAIAGKGSEKIIVAGVKTGNIVGYTSASEMLYYNVGESKWQTNVVNESYSAASLTATTAEDLVWAAENCVGTVTLGNDVTLTEAAVFSSKATLDLNGKKVACENNTVIKANKGADLTVTGNGVVWGAESNNGNSQAVMANGGKVTIKNGTFKVGGDLNNTDRNDCIYAINGGHIIIEGGEFEYTGNVAESDRNTGKDGNKYLLNLKDDTDSNGTMGDNNVIEVIAGKFWRFNPAHVASEPASTDITSFVKMPPAVGSFATVVGQAEETTASTNLYNYAWGEVFYTVK